MAPHTYGGLDPKTLSELPLYDLGEACNAPDAVPAGLCTNVDENEGIQVPKQDLKVICEIPVERVTVTIVRCQK